MRIWQKSVLLLLTLCLLSVQSAFAENRTWKDKAFDFRSVALVRLYEPVYPQNVTDEMDRWELRDYFWDQAGEKISDVRFTTNDFAGGKADLFVEEEIQTYAVEKTWREPYLYKTTEYETVKYTDKEGRKYERRVPHEVTKEMPGAYIYTSYVKVRFNVYDKRNKLVLRYEDQRSAQKELIDMYKRIVRNFYSALEKTDLGERAGK